MTKKDKAKKIIISILGKVKSLNHIELVDQVQHQLENVSSTTVRRALKDLREEAVVVSEDNISLKMANTKPLHKIKAEEKDMYEKAADSIKEVLDQGIAAKVREHRDKFEDIVWIMDNEKQLKHLSDRWAEMKAANYKRIIKISVTPLDKPVRPDGEDLPKSNQKSDTKRYTMDERIQMKKFFINLGATEIRAIDLVKDVVGGKNTEGNIEKTLREEKQQQIGLVTPKTQHQRTVSQLRVYDRLLSNLKDILKVNNNIAPKIALNLVKNSKVEDLTFFITDEIKKEYEEVRSYLIQDHKLNEYHSCRIAYGSIANLISDIDAEVEKVKAQDAPKPEAKKPTPKKKKATPIKKRYTRVDSLAEAINSGIITDLEGLIEKSNEFYVKNGGKDNLKESKWFANYGLGLLESMGILEWKSDGKAFFHHLSSQILGQKS